MKHKPHNFRPMPKINYARFKFTLILLALLSLGYYVKADDTSCHTAIELQQATIESLQHRLATAQSLPYNQGYQAGYKVATLEANPLYKQFIEIMGCIFIALIFACLIVGYIVYSEKHKTNARL
jgi:hypothetical protein